MCESRGSNSLNYLSRNNLDRLVVFLSQTLQSFVRTDIEALICLKGVEDTHLIILHYLPVSSCLRNTIRLLCS